MSGVLVAAVLTPHRRFLLRHTFSGAALAPSDLGPPLGNISGTLTVGSGYGTNGSSTTKTGANVGAANFVAQAKFRFLGTSVAVDRRAAIQFRDNLADLATMNGFEAYLDRINGSVNLGSRANGAYTSIGSAVGALSNDTDYWIRVVASGPRIEVLTSTDGSVFTSRIVATSALYPGQMGVAIRITDAGAAGSGGGVRVDDLLVWSGP